ncbi:MAG TPA: ArsR family transcriptional regulator [Longimicrobiaceae bacterium]|nr:ArsR family transcriptional regulator [Longimicrobiaceae bacterium]
MQGTPWIQRLLASTRGQIVALLRRSSLTVNEMADSLQLTDNAVRSHLAALERDGLVRQQSVRRGVGKPAYVYSLTPEADTLLPKAYAPVLGLLLRALQQRMGRDEVRELLRQVGEEAARGRTAASEDARARLDAAYGVLGEMGGVADVEEADGVITIRGYSCPLAAVVPEHPEACGLIEALLSAMVGAPVREQCDKGERPRCCFEIRLDGAEGGPANANPTEPRER